jgi:hypothetical protein
VDLEARKDKGDTYRVFVAKHKGKRFLGIYIGVHVKIILKWTLKEENGRAWTELIWLRIGKNGELL